MMSSIDFYFEFGSPYSYIAAQCIGAVAAKHDRTVRWLPIDLGKIWRNRNVLEAYGAIRKLKGNFVFKDALMVAASRGIAMKRPVRGLSDTRLAKLVVHHLNAQGYDRGAAFGLAVWNRFFEDGVDISSEQDLLGAAGDQISLRDLQEAASSDLAANSFAQASEAAQASGCFGVPWIIVDDEPFFGQDRLELIDWWLQRRTS
jgi:2-hydroxychromene-2-carboxylate isomerase